MSARGPGNAPRALLHRGAFEAGLRRTTRRPCRLRTGIHDARGIRDKFMGACHPTWHPSPVLSGCPHARRATRRDRMPAPHASALPMSAWRPSSGERSLALPRSNSTSQQQQRAPEPNGSGARSDQRGSVTHLSSSSSSGLSTTRVSVVSSRAAMEAALARAERVTLTGSMTPSAMRSTY